MPVGKLFTPHPCLLVSITARNAQHLNLPAAGDVMSYLPDSIYSPFGNAESMSPFPLLGLLGNALCALGAKNWNL